MDKKSKEASLADASQEVNAQARSEFEDLKIQIQQSLAENENYKTQIQELNAMNVAYEQQIETQQAEIDQLKERLAKQNTELADNCPAFEYKGAQYRVKHGVHARNGSDVLTVVPAREIAATKKLREALVDSGSSAVEKI